MLSALDAGVDAGATTGCGDAGGFELPADKSSAELPDSSSASSQSGVDPLQANAALLLAQAPVADPLQANAQPALVPASVGDPFQAAALTLPPGLAGQPLVPAVPVPVAVVSVDVLPPGVKVGPTKVGAAVAEDASLSALPSLPTDALSNLKKLRELDVPSQEAVPSAINSASKFKAGVLGGAASAGQEARDFRALHVPDVSAWGASLTQALVAAEGRESRASEADRNSAKPISTQLGVTSEGSWGAQSLVQDAQQVTTYAPVSEASALSPETRVAEQVSYWVSHDVQNAQLRLDGLGGEPVEVNISMNGNEAQVEFRTDLSETRQILEGSVSQLKDLLSREGLVLSGVSVGASFQGHPGSQQRRDQAGARQAKVEVLAAPSEVRLSSASPRAGRALDLFV